VKATKCRHRSGAAIGEEKVVSTTNVIVNESICDVALVSEARAENNNAFDELSRRYSSRLMGSIRRMLRDRCDAEDALQETLLRVFTHLKSSQGRSSVSTWMTRIAVNAALARLRKNRGIAVSIDEVREETGLALSSLLQDGALDAERRLIHAQQEELLAKAIAQLPPSLRSVLKLRIRDGYSGKADCREDGHLRSGRQIAPEPGPSPSSREAILPSACAPATCRSPVSPVSDLRVSKMLRTEILLTFIAGIAICLTGGVALAKRPDQDRPSLSTARRTYSTTTITSARNTGSANG
jgi:RNA polymerase sigma-70 factor (ECF subfamily)